MLFSYLYAYVLSPSGFFDVLTNFLKAASLCVSIAFHFPCYVSSL